MYAQGESKLHIAAAKGDLVKIKKLISNGADLCAVNSLGQTALCYAVANHHIQCIKTLAKRTIGSHPRINEDVNACFAAVAWGNKEIMDLIVDVSCRNSVGATPLFEAVIQNNFETVRYLLNQGAEVNVVNMYDDSPLFFACMIGNLKIIKLLHSYGADICRKDSTGYTPVMCARMFNHNDVVKYLTTDVFAVVTSLDDYETSNKLIAVV